MKPTTLRLAALLLSAAAGCSTSNASPLLEGSAPTASEQTTLPAAVRRPGVLPEAPGPADKIRDKTLATSQAYETVQSLCDEVGPRLSGSPGDRAAVAWAQRTLTAKGFQNVRAEKVMVPHWERGDAAAQLVAPYPHTLAVAALGRSIGTPPEGIEADVVEVTSLEALEKLPREAVEGKIVFVWKETERTRDGMGYAHAVGVRAYAAVAAAKLGAVAVVIRSIGTDGDRLPHTGAMRYDPAVTSIPAAALAIPDADMLHRIVAGGQPVRLSLRLGCQTLPDVESANVVGEVLGAEAPDEIILMGAHLDSWDLGTGAIDDGAGVAAVIEAARQISVAPRRPRRTVRVVLFANEEAGLAGAKAYAEAHAGELDRHVLAMEADLGAARVFEARFLGSDQSRPAFLEIVRPLESLGVAVSSGDAFGGADVSPLRAQGVPIADLVQDMSHYFDLHHTANDVMSKIVRDDIDQVAAAYAAFAFGAADAPGGFGRIPEDKRKSPF